jgi:hypothetical protein
MKLPVMRLCPAPSCFITFTAHINPSNLHPSTSIDILSRVIRTFVSRKNSLNYLCCGGARGTVVVKALCYKPEGRGFDTR